MWNHLYSRDRTYLPVHYSILHPTASITNNLLTIVYLTIEANDSNIRFAAYVHRFH